MRSLPSLTLAASLSSLALATSPATATPPGNVTLLGHLPLDPGCGYSDALFVHDGLAYVMELRKSGTACDIQEGWLRIIDVSDPQTPAHISQTRLRGNSPGDMHGIYYSNGYLYCAIQSQAPGVAIYDVSDPRNPVEVSFVFIEAGVHNLRVAAGHMYVMPNSDNPEDIMIFDISDPWFPAQVGSFDSPGPFCHDLSVMEDVGYAACWNEGLYLLDLRDPTSVAVIGSYSNASQGSFHSAWPTPDRRTVVTCQETNDQGLRTFDVSSGSPIPAAQYNLGDGTLIHDVMVVGRYGYVTYYDDGVKILDLADPTVPLQVGNFWSGDTAIAQWLEDGLLYVVDMQSGFWVVSFDLPHDAPITMYAVKSASLRDVNLTWNHTGESQYTLRDGLDKRTVGTRLVDIDGELHHTESSAVLDARTHYYKLNGPWR